MKSQTLRTLLSQKENLCYFERILLCFMAHCIGNCPSLHFLHQSGNSFLLNFTVYLGFLNLTPSFEIYSKFRSAKNFKIHRKSCRLIVFKCLTFSTKKNSLNFPHDNRNDEKKSSR